MATLPHFMVSTFFSLPQNIRHTETGKAANWPPFLFLAYAKILHFMALDAVTGRDESILAVVAGAARFTFVHIVHFGLECACLVREYLGVAVNAFVHAEMDIVAEVGFSRFCFKEDVAWFIAFMAFVALTGDGKCILAVVAAAT